MRGHVVVAVLAVAAAAACGSSSDPAAAPPPAPAPEPAPEPDQTPTIAQPGPSPTPEPAPSPTPSPQPIPTPTPTPGPTPSPAPPPDRFVDVERLDASAECDALVVTSVPAPVTITTGSPGVGGCGPGLSDGTGHVAAQVGSGRGSYLQVFGSDGRTEQRLALTSEAWPQPEGWLGLEASTSGVPSFASLRSFFPDGTPRRTERPGSSAVQAAAPDPRGGAALVLWRPTGGGTCIGELRRFDATGAPAGGTTEVGCGTASLGISTTGGALVLDHAPGGGAMVQWIRADGTAAGPPAPEPGTSPGGELSPLLDGSLVLRTGRTWQRRWPHLSTASEPAPPWLAARADQAFRFTRGGRGYAFFPPPGQQRADCTQIVEVVAPSGRRCARLTFRRDGNACVTGAIDQGWDGTVVQQLGSLACGWRFWPRLLAGD